MTLTPSQIETLFKKTLKGIEDGTPLRQLLGTPGNISKRKFYELLNVDENYRARYAHAKEIAAELLFDEMLEIAKNPLTETITTIGDSYSITTKDNVQRSRLMIDAIKWRLAKELPKKYGDKLDVTSDNKPIGLPAIVGMVIKNETTADDNSPEPTEPDNSDLF